MNLMKERLVTWLFQTNALRISPGSKPFWYTSGMIGPYYINTQFLYGSEQKANELLKIIDEEKKAENFPLNLMENIQLNYKEDSIYKNVIDDMCQFIKDNINLDEVDYISGGERRDWFFSLIAAEKLEKPHISILKDLSTIVTESRQIKKVDSLTGKNILHIADLLTVGSSYERAWIPAVANLGGTIKWSVVVVDRLQGGSEMLSAKGIKSFTMIDINKSLFERSISMGLIDKEQYNMVLDYIDSPNQSMKEFLESNPEFLRNALKADAKTRERAQLCLEENMYNLDISKYSQD